MVGGGSWVFGQWRFIAIWIRCVVGVAIILRSITSNPPLGVVMKEERSILVKLKGFRGSCRVMEGGREGRKGGIRSLEY